MDHIWLVEIFGKEWRDTDLWFLSGSFSEEEVREWCNDFVKNDSLLQDRLAYNADYMPRHLGWKENTLFIVIDIFEPDYRPRYYGTPLIIFTKRNLVHRME